MAIDFYLDPLTGDIDLTNNTMRLTNSIEESSRQQILITLRGYRGEWVFNINAYLPWLANENNPAQLLGAGSSKQYIDSLIKQQILFRENITDVISYESTFNKITREMVVNFKARTTSGEVISIRDLPLG